MQEIKRGDVVEIIWEKEDSEYEDIGMSGLVSEPLTKGFYSGENYLFIGHLQENPEDCIIQDERRKVHLWRQGKNKLKKSDREFKYSRFA